MVDTVLILVDAMDGPMPQTRFVTQKAFAMGFKPIVVVNKVDRPGARPEWVVEQVWDLFEKLGANDEQMEFPIVYASGAERLRLAWTRHRPRRRHDPAVRSDHAARAEAGRRIRKVRSKCASASWIYNNFVGVIGIGRIQRGTLKKGMPVAVIDRRRQEAPGQDAARCSASSVSSASSRIQRRGR